MACDIELHLPVQQPQLALELLQAHCELSKNRLKTVMQKGAVWLTRGQQTKRLRRAKAELVAGDTLHMYYDASTIDLAPPAALLLADEGDYSLWCKPAGMFTQGTKWGDHHTITRWAEQRLAPQRTAKIVHRLDRHTTGLILLAHSKKAAAALSALFRQREIEKTYWAVVEGCSSAAPEPQIIDSEIDGKTAYSEVRRLAELEGRSLLEVKIGSGRKHQVRRHLSEAGLPIVGDRLFGEDSSVGLQLAAVRLVFNCPLTGQRRDYQLPEVCRPSLPVKNNLAWLSALEPLAALAND